MEYKKAPTKLIEKEIRFVIAGGTEQGELEEGDQNVQTSCYNTNKYRDVMYNRITIVNTAG